MANDNLYDDGADTMPAKEKDDGVSTALLPKDFFPESPEVGKVCKIRVERVMDDQVSVVYVKDEEKESEDEVEMPPADEEMESYMS